MQSCQHTSTPHLNTTTNTPTDHTDNTRTANTHVLATPMLLACLSIPQHCHAMPAYLLATDLHSQQPNEFPRARPLETCTLHSPEHCPPALKRVSTSYYQLLQLD